MGETPLEKRAMQLRGIKRGRAIELQQELELPDGCEIVVEVHPSMSIGTEERLQRLSQLFGAWSDRQDLDAAFDAIATQRHQYRGRDVANFD
ncbi:hypothetical protein CKA32_006681 [Geitlerinema sp. FC II]|nr:hypothetical protein CKA32_006681 [Geitlerinema sp. FC II]